MDEHYAELLRRALSGDQAAAAALYGLLKPVLGAVIGPMLRESKARRVLDPSDAVQTAFRRLLEKGGPPPDNLVAWCMTVAVRRVLEQQRSPSVSRTEPQADVLGECLVAKGKL